MRGVNLKGLLSHHVPRGFLVVLESLGLVNFLHLGGETVLTGEDEERRVVELLRDSDLLNLLAEVLLEPIGKWLVHFLQLLGLLLGGFIRSFENADIVFSNRFDLAFLVLSQVLGSELINRVV